MVPRKQINIERIVDSVFVSVSWDSYNINTVMCNACDRGRRVRAAPARLRRGSGAAPARHRRGSGATRTLGRSDDASYQHGSSYFYMVYLVPLENFIIWTIFENISIIEGAR